MRKIVIAILATLTLSACGFEIVDTGYRGIETRLGAVQGEPLPEGLHFYNPFTSSITEYSVRQEKWEETTSIFTRDTQNVSVKFAVVYYADPAHVHTLFRDVGRLDALTDKIIKPVVLGSIKDAIGEVIADELVMKRELVTKSALKEVVENLEKKNVIVTDLQFVNLDFDNAYEQAVEQKVVAIQNAQKAKNETVRIQEEAFQTVKTAQAEAESMRIKSQALAQNKGLVQFELAKKWDGVLPVYMFGNSVPLIDLKSMTK
ncbi:MAG: prohibitin family protein [Bdellovibrionaceae bacterium]|nr:prohibitin family protein [Pseudobdellovibrionaceae bacterium]